MKNAFSTDYTYSLCEKCQAAICCASYIIPLTALDVLRYSISFDITPKEFMLRYTVDSFEDQDFIETNEYIQKYYKEEKIITFLARRIPFAHKTSFCIFIMYDKNEKAMRCASYNCRSDACRVCYADHCMTQGGAYESVIYSKALMTEKLSEPYLESEWARGLYNLSKHSYEAREEFKKGFSSYRFEYDLKKYQIDINEKLLRFEKYLNESRFEKYLNESVAFYKDISIDMEMIKYPKYLNKISFRENYKTKPEICWYRNDMPIYKHEFNVYLQPVIKNYRIKNNLSTEILNGLRFIDSYIKYFPVRTTEKQTLNAKIKSAKLLNKASIVTSGETKNYINLIIKDFKRDLTNKYPSTCSQLMKINFKTKQEIDGSFRDKVTPSTNFNDKVTSIFLETLSMVCYLSNKT